MNNKNRSNVVKYRITRESEKKKKEEEDLKKKTKIRNVVRTRLEVKKMRSFEETHLRSEDVGLSSLFLMTMMVVLPRWRLEPMSCIIWVQTL